jgi:hypothetical protein
MEVPQPARTEANLGGCSRTVTCGDGRRWTYCLLMACKRSGVRIPVDSHFRRSKTCSGSSEVSLSACSPASSTSWRSSSGPRSMQVRSVLHGWRTTVSLPSLVDSQTDSQSIIRAAPVRVVAISSAQRCLATFGESRGSSDSVEVETDRPEALATSSLPNRCVRIGQSRIASDLHIGHLDVVAAPSIARRERNCRTAMVVTSGRCEW